jgi:hypothetical protein
MNTNKEKDLEVFFMAHYYMNMSYTSYANLSTEQKDWLSKAISKAISKQSNK